MAEYLREEEAREQLCEIGRRVYARGLVAANDGNFSARIAPGLLIATPTGVSKGFMAPEMMVKLDTEGKLLADGGLAPSSEIKIHLEVYRHCPDVNGVVHTHPPVATAYAAAGTPLDEAVLTESALFLGVVPVAPFAPPGSDALPASMAPFCTGYNAVLLAHHGAVTWGSSPMEAFFRTESLELTATTHMHLRHTMGSGAALTRAQVDEVMELRKKWGFTRGGRPRCREDLENLDEGE